MPAKKPTRLKEVKGTLRKSRQNGNEPVPPAELPVPPEWLMGEALKEWKRITAELEPLGYLSRLDRGILTLYCILWARIADAGQGKGEPLKAAEVAQFRTCAASLGLDPVSRSRIDVVPPKGKSEKFSKWERF